MQLINPQHRHPLHRIGATRAWEQDTAAALPPHTLMARAGLAVARLALALAPHAQRIWVACGPGNNGGDGLEAAAHLHQWGKQVSVTWLGTPDTTPADAMQAWQQAQRMGLMIAQDWPASCDLCIDALLGLGTSRQAQGPLASCIAHINQLPAPVLAVDLPSGLHADTGLSLGEAVRAQHTLSLLTLKTGLFTGEGRDYAGQVWWDTLGTDPQSLPAQAWLNPAPPVSPRAHSSHKRTYGDLAVIGGAPGMAGAALLAAQAALHQGAGRVLVAMLDPGFPTADPSQPELMFRDLGQLQPEKSSAVLGCGGGQAVAAVLPRFLSRCPALVLDADALNAIAHDTTLEQLLRARRTRHWQTVLTPHPLEAARLLGCTTQAVQSDRLNAARQLVDTLGSTVVLKGSGTIVMAPEQLPVINPTGNARLATGGTGDVLAGMIGARLARGETAFDAACAAVWLHGQSADAWPTSQPLTAGLLARTALR